MSARTDVYSLASEIGKSLEVLEKIEQFYETKKRGLFSPRGRNREKSIIIAEIFFNYYTCLETIFLRISQFFENNLAADKWHRDLLEKMALEIEQVRPRVLSDESVRTLGELLRFRHFKRYYLEFDYDWDRLEFLRKKLDSARPRVRAEIAAFVAALKGAGN